MIYSKLTFLKSIKFYLIIAFSCINLLTSQTSTSLDVIVRDVTDLDIGFNRRSDQGTWWTDTSFINLVSEMNPDVVRYPAGTQANYWDWREGRFLENTDKTWGDKEILKIPEFVAALPISTKAIYVVNMARPTPITGVDVNDSDAILKSQSTLNAKIVDMLAAIAEFDAQGKLPFAVELGNEFYFGNIESGIFEIVESNGLYYSGWDDINNQPFVSSSKPEATEIIAKFYLDQCKDIVSAIKATYPSIKIILTTTKGGYASRDSWNNTIFNELENNPIYTNLKNDTYAVTQHHYIKNDGLMTPISDNATSKIAIAEGIEYPISKQSDYDLIPIDYKLWITEYGAVKEIAEETWASAVRYAAFTYGWIELGDKIEQLDWHYISDNNVVNDNNSPMVLAPVGISVKLLQKAALDMSDMQKISFSPNPISVNAVNSLYGYKFKNAQKETLFIINTSDSDFSQVQFSNLLTYSGQPTMTQFYSNTPYINGVYEGHPNIVSINSDVTNNIDINRFSVTVIEAENETLNLSDLSVKSFNIYPNPVKDFLQVKTDFNIISVRVMNFKGQKVLESNLIDNKLDLRSLNSGIFFIEIKTDQKTIVKKLIKM